MSSILAVLLTAAVSSSSGQSSDSVAILRAGASPVDLGDGVHFEISPHAGLMGGSGTFGLRLGVNYSSLQIELAGEQVIGKTANMYPVSLNAVLNLATRGRLIPYGAVGAGLLLTVPTTTIGDRTVSTLGVNFGGGARYFLTRTFGIRAEVKQYMTSVEHSIESGSKLLIFQELTLGVVFLFR